MGVVLTDCMFVESIAGQRIVYSLVNVHATHTHKSHEVTHTCAHCIVPHCGAWSYCTVPGTARPKRTTKGAKPTLLFDREAANRRNQQANVVATPAPPPANVPPVPVRDFSPFADESRRKSTASHCSEVGRRSCGVLCASVSYTWVRGLRRDLTDTRHSRPCVAAHAH